MPFAANDPPVTPFDLERELEIACQAVAAAAVACATIAPAPGRTVEKEDRSPVTLADFTAQALVCAALSEASAITAVVGEERAADVPAALAGELAKRVGEARGAGVDAARVRDWLAIGEADPAQHAWFWALDPVDGTKGFLRGGQWAVALALIGDGAVQLGVLACPRYEGGLLFAARRGGGGTVGPLHTPGDRALFEPGPAPARTCESVEAGHSDHDRAVRVAARVGLTEPSLRMDSQVKYAAIARGDAAAYLRLPTSTEYREKIWDHAAGQILVEETGGRVSDVHGAPLDFTRGRTLAANRGVIATRADLHASVLEALAAEGV
jgi:3'-phosphoadenosine 5'-phosphosulfate (PAPS) 3'-phosphatase